MSALRRSLACFLSRSTGRNLGDHFDDDPSSTALNSAEEEPPTWAFTNRSWRSRGICPVHTEEVTGSIPVSPTRSEAYRNLDAGVHSPASYTVRAAVDDWLAEGLSGRAPKTVSTQREVLEPLLDIIGQCRCVSSRRLTSGPR